MCFRVNLFLYLLMSFSVNNPFLKFLLIIIISFYYTILTVGNLLFKILIVFVTTKCYSLQLIVSITVFFIFTQSLILEDCIIAFCDIHYVSCHKKSVDNKFQYCCTRWIISSSKYRILIVTTRWHDQYYF